jgi:hypothetical protein
MQESQLRYVRYNYKRGPGYELKHGGILEINCQGWVHSELQNRFDITLPHWLLSKELFEDNGIFVTTVKNIADIRPGAIFLFGPQDLPDMKKLHVALYSGYRIAGTHEPLLEHVNVVDKTVGFWPLNKFSQTHRYEQLYAIKQPIKRVQ